VKIITKCIIKIETLKIVEEESYEYFGPVSKCKGGGGSGAGVVDYPIHMKSFQESWLDHAGADTITDSITDVVNSALGNSPWIGKTAYDPDSDLTDLIAAPATLQTLVSLLSSGTSLDAVIANILSDSYIDNAVTEYAADLDARLTSEVLPRFEAGLRDINAVVSSSFVIGRALIEENQDRQVAKYSADLHLKAASDDAIKIIGMKLEYQKAVSQMISEANRIKIVAKKEESDANMEIDEADALWDIELFQYGANLLASIGGGTHSTKSPKGISKTASAIGGGMAGAAGGALVGAEVGTAGGAWGALIGGVLGAAAGLLS